VATTQQDARKRLEELRRREQEERGGGQETDRDRLNALREKERQASDAALADQTEKEIVDMQSGGGVLNAVGEFGRDVKTSAQIGVLTTAEMMTGATRKENELQLRQETKRQLWDILPEDERAAIRARAGKPLGQMRWQDFNAAAEEEYGTREWNQRLRGYMGFQEGDMHEPSGPEAFPGARTLIGGSIETGTLNFYEKVIRPWFSDDGPQRVGTISDEIEELTQQYTPETKESVDKTFLAEDATWNPLTWFDETTKDPYHDFAGFLHTTIQQAGNIGAMIIAARTGGGIHARQFTKSQYRPGMSTAEIQGIQATGARVGGAAAGGKAESVMIRDGVYSETYNSILDVPDEVWDKNEEFQEALSTGMDRESAKQLFAMERANAAGDTAMVLSGVAMGTPMGAFYGGMVGRSGGRALAQQSVLKGMGKGALYESGQEMAQEATEQLSSNVAIRKIDPNKDIWENVGEAVVSAFFVSGPYGALGGIRRDKGAGIPEARDKLIRAAQPYANASNQRWKYQNKVSAKKFTKDASPQQKLKAMIELERLQKKEAEAFMAVKNEARKALEKFGKKKDIVRFDAQTVGYQQMLADIAKQQARRNSARRELRLEREAVRKRKAKQAETTMNFETLHEVTEMVTNMEKVRIGEVLEKEDYALLERLGYGRFSPGGRDFSLTRIGIDAMTEMEREAKGLREKIRSGYTGPERRVDVERREEYDNMTPDEFRRVSERHNVTGMPNDRAWDKEKTDYDAVAFVDADTLKWVNDTMSMSAGDEMLRVIADELTNLGRGIKAYHKGGDEWVIGGPNEQVLEEVLQQAANRLASGRYITEGQQRVRPTVTWGTAPTEAEAEALAKGQKDRRRESGAIAERGEVPPNLEVVPDTRAEEPPSKQAGTAVASIYKGDDEVFEVDEDGNIYEAGTTNQKHEYDALTMEWIDWQKAREKSRAYKYARAIDYELSELEDQHLEWVFEAVDNFLPQGMANNPGATVVWDDEHLKKINKGRWQELDDMPFGKNLVRGLFSIDAPTDGVFLIAKNIVNQVKNGLKRGHKIQTWSGSRYRTHEDDIIEVIDENGKVHKGVVKSIHREQGGSEVKGGDNVVPLTKLIAARNKMRLAREKMFRINREVKKMSKEKRDNPKHPLNRKYDKAVGDVANAAGNLSELEREAYGTYRTYSAPDYSLDEIVVEVNGEEITFLPKENVVAAGTDKDLYLGRIKDPKSRIWHSNLGNTEAAKDEPLTREAVQKLTATTLMHEVVGHYGIRGLTKDYKTYERLTHALVDSFPEYVADLKRVGYAYNDELTASQNKALFGEEILAWHLERHGTFYPNSLNVKQKSAIRRFLTWVKEQLLRLGFNTFHDYVRGTAKLRSQIDAVYAEIFELDKNMFSGPAKKKDMAALYDKLVPLLEKMEKKSYFNDDDLMVILRRSHQFLMNGGSKWRWKGEDNFNHVALPIKDQEIFAKPGYDVVAKGTRELYDSEKISEEEAAIEEPPTVKEAYKQVTGNNPPLRWKLIQIRDFQEEAKRLRDEGVQTNPKKLFEEKVPEDQQKIMMQVTGVIEKATKEATKKKSLLSAKKKNIEKLAALYGKEVIESGRVPVFPDYGTVQDFITAANEALPGSGRKGSIAPMEFEASGIMEALYPSMFNVIVINLFNYGYDGSQRHDMLANDIGISRKRYDQLREDGGVRMTKAEAKKLEEHLKRLSELVDLPLDTPNFHSGINNKVMEENNALTIEDLISPDTFGYAPSAINDAYEWAIMLAYGENSNDVKEYRAAKAGFNSVDPDVAREAAIELRLLRDKPLDLNKALINKDWLLERMKTPKWQVAVHHPRKRFRKWDDIAKTELGIESPDWDLMSAQERNKVKELQRKDQETGVDIGYQEATGTWVHPLDLLGDNGQPQQFNSGSGWTAPGMIPESYNVALFWQDPHQSMSGSVHFSGYNPLTETNTEYGQFAHTRYYNVYDADANMPDAANPDMQGQALVFLESQSDQFQKRSKQYRSEKEYDEATARRSADSKALNTFYKNYQGLWGNVFVDYLFERTESVADPESEVLKEHLFGRGLDEESFDELTEDELKTERLIWKIWSIRDDVYNTLDAALTETQSQDHIGKASERLDSIAAGERFLSDARMFELLDQRAMQMILGDIKARLLRGFSSELSNIVNANRDATTKHQYVRRYGIESYLRNSAMGKDTSQLLNSFQENFENAASRLASIDEDNQPGHRLSVMADLPMETLNHFIDQLSENIDKDALAANYVSGADIHNVRIEFPSNAFDTYFKSGSESVLAEYNLSWGMPRRRTFLSNAIRKSLKRHGDSSIQRSGDAYTVTLTGQSVSELSPDKVAADVIDTLVDDAIKNGLENIGSESINAITDEMEQLRYGVSYSRNTRSVNQHINGQIYILSVSEDADNPLQHAWGRNTSSQNGAWHRNRELPSIEDTLTIMRENNIETFDQYSARKWAAQWERLNAEEGWEMNEDWVAAGVDENNPPESFYEGIAGDWNNSDKPFFYEADKIPLQWDINDDGTANITEYGKLIAYREKIGDDVYAALFDSDGNAIDEETFDEGINDNWDFVESLWGVTRRTAEDFHQSITDVAGSMGPELFQQKTTNGRRNQELSLAQQMEELRDKLREAEGDVPDLGATLPEIAEKLKEGLVSPEIKSASYMKEGEEPLAGLERAFLSEIDFNKKAGSYGSYPAFEPMERNDQWKSVTMLWAVTEAVRQGVPRIFLLPGDAQGFRGAYGTNLGSRDAIFKQLDKINWRKETQVIRGKQTEVITINSPELPNNLMVDVSKDLIQELTAVLGADVAAKIDSDINKGDSRKEEGVKHFISASATNQWIVHDAYGNIVYIADDKEGAEHYRDNIQSSGPAEPDVPHGTITAGVLGGPIQLLRPYYAGSPPYQYYGSSYRHTVARPTTEGGRRQYDLVYPGKFQTYLEQFGIKMEEGKMKVPVDKMELALTTGGRKTVSMPAELVERFPNIEITEITGENYGFIIGSDNGLVLQNVFANRQEAQEALDEWVAENQVDSSGAITVMQFTLNDEVREAHKRPVNPYVRYALQEQNDPYLAAARKKIGKTRPKLADRFKAWKSSWRQAMNQGMFDKFAGIKYALDRSGSDQVGYMLARLTTGLESIMRGVMEFGHPVWRDGVIESEGKGLTEILQRVASQIDGWTMYMAGKRSKRLMLEGINKALTFRQRYYLGAEGFKHPEHADEIIYGSWMAAKNQTDATLEIPGNASKDERIAANIWDMILNYEKLKADPPISFNDMNDFDRQAVRHIQPHMYGNVNNQKRRKVTKEGETRGASALMMFNPRQTGIWPAKKRKAAAKLVSENPGATMQEAEAAIDKAVDVQMWALLQAKSPLLEKVIEQGREQLFAPLEIQSMVRLENEFPVFKDVAEDYAAFNKKMLDFAEASGVVSSETRPLWENADYIPFYRIEDDRMVGPMAKGIGLANQKSPVKTLRGGSQNLGDLVNNIIMNMTSLMDSSIKNHAALRIVDELKDTGLVRKMPYKFTKELIPMGQLGKILKQHGMDIKSIPEEALKGLQSMFAIKPPSGDGVISVMRDGKKEYYFTDDPLLFRAMSSINMKAFGAWMSLLRAPKRLLTSWITLDPGFMVANFVRDTQSAFALSRDKFVPLFHGLDGFRKAITEGDSMKAMIASGSAFESGYINQGDPKAARRIIKKSMRDAGFRESVLDSPRKLYEAYKRLGSAVENSNRVAVYEAAKRAGKSDLQASYEAKDLMDFSMGGDWPFIQFLIQTVPFMGARLQGAHRLGRGVKEHPVAFTIKGTLIGLAGMALYLAFRDDDRYKELEDWDKDTYFHWWIGDDHYRLPKGFEVGTLFNSIPERIFEYMYSEENDAGKYMMRRWGWMIAEVFNMNPIPQAAQPLVEGYFNKNFFRGRSIESPWETGRLPEDRYKYYTSPTMQEISATLPRQLDTVSQKIRSPLHLQNLYEGYTGTLGRYFLMASDIAIREMNPEKYPSPPAFMPEDYPIVSRFYRGSRPRRTRYEEEFYSQLRLTLQVKDSMSFNERMGTERGDNRYDEIEAEYLPYVDAAQDFEGFRKEISDLNREMMEIYNDPNMARQKKRSEINAIQKEKNIIFKEAYELRPANNPISENEPIDAEKAEWMIRNFNASNSSQLQEAAPATAGLVGDVTKLNPQNLQRLEKAANYRDDR
jgi:GGDEF domain-containing protein